MKLSVLSNDDFHMRINNNELNDNTAAICFYSKAFGKPKELIEKYEAQNLEEVFERVVKL